MKASCDIPVNISNVVAKLVFPNLRESHSPTLEGRMILAGEDVLAQSASLDLDLPNFL